MVFAKLFGKPQQFDATVPPGRRVYAIGDIHGRLDCLDDLIARIGADHAARGPAEIELILLGDLIDRGPESRGVIDRVQAMDRDVAPTRMLIGNHEELLLRAATGEREAISVFDRAGGRETMLSYGVDAADYDRCSLADVAGLIQRVVPDAHLSFLAAQADRLLVGGYVFVHAGVRPGVALDQQVTGDLRWIREPFLSHKGSFGAMIVHGHTITTEPDIRPNRIGIDTGAYRSGTLTAIALEGNDRWFLQTDLATR